jgi:hypothetical protein
MIGTGFMLLFVAAILSNSPRHSPIYNAMIDCAITGAILVVLCFSVLCWSKTLERIICGDNPINRNISRTILYQEQSPVIRFADANVATDIEKQMEPELAVAIYIQNNQNSENVENSVVDICTETIVIAKPIN